MSDAPAIVTLDSVARRIFELRGQRVMLDADLAVLYGVETKYIVRAIKRNPERFPEDFMFQLSLGEWDSLKCQIGTSKKGRGGRRFAPYVFTEHGALMLSSVLNSPRADEIKNSSAFVFIDPETGEPYRSRRHFMKRLCKLAGVKHFGFHAIRHLSATILAYGGLDIPTVQAVLRHKNPNTTARYIKSLGVQPDKLDRIFERRKKRLKSTTLRASEKSDWHII